MRKDVRNEIIRIGGDNIDLSKLIEEKEAIIANKRYPLSDNYSYIYYI